MARLETPNPTQPAGAGASPPGPYKERLVVHVLWHPKFGASGTEPGGKELAEQLYSILTRELDDPLARGIGIPVYFRTSVDEAGSPPPDIPPDDAHHTVVVVLIDDQMVLGDGWGEYVARLDGTIREANARHGDRRHRLLPVMISENAFNLDERLDQTNFVRLCRSDPGKRPAAFAISVAHELCRVLKDVPPADYSALDGAGAPAAPVAPEDDERVIIFISHTKAGDERGIEKALRELLKKHARDGDDGPLPGEILRYFKDHADDDPAALPLDRFLGEASQGSGPELVAGLRTLFAAFAKADRGKAIAEAIRDYVNADLQLQTFFDARDIPYGADFGAIIARSIDRSALLIVQTDAYASRIWCQIEVLLAKRNHRPALVVNAVRAGERRAFPYLGNVPTIRFSGARRPNYPEIIAQMLLEVLRTLHFKQHFDDLCTLFQIPRGSIECLTLSPELLTMVDLRRRNDAVKRFVYPDPPLGENELDLLRALDPALTVTTPVFLLGTNAKSADQAAPETTATAGPTPRLHGLTVGLSISDSPDLGRLGMGKAHLEEANAGLARYLLASGASLAYGGDFRPEGFTEQLLDLVRTHNAERQGTPKARLRWFLAWPLQVAIPPADMARYRDACDFVRVDPPADLGVDKAQVPGPPRTPEERYVRARCFTAMRERMDRAPAGASAIDARLLLGGRTVGYAGRYPGLVEEAYLALRDGIPLYLVGGFGGCARAIIQALLGKSPRRLADGSGAVVLDPLPRPDGIPEELTEAYQRAHTPGYPELIDVYRAKHPDGPDECRIDYPAVLAAFRASGLAGLKNGLTDDENLRLFTTPFVVEIIQLVLLGLSRLSHP